MLKKIVFFIWYLSKNPEKMYYSFHKNTKHYKATFFNIDDNKKCFLNSKSANNISQYYCFYCILQPWRT